MNSFLNRSKPKLNYTAEISNSTKFNIYKLKKKIELFYSYDMYISNIYCELYHKSDLTQYKRLISIFTKCHFFFGFKYNSTRVLLNMTYRL